MLDTSAWTLKGGLPFCLFGNTSDTSVIYEKAKFVCFIYMQPQIHICSMSRISVTDKTTTAAPPSSPEASKASAKETFDQIYLMEMKKLQFGTYQDLTFTG